MELLKPGPSVTVLGLVLLACLTDYYDGPLARRAGVEPSLAGRLTDNLCDIVFLLLVHVGFALRELWSPPVWGRAIQYWEYVNWLPVLALLAAFLPYLLRSLWDGRAGRPTMRSTRGHTAGIANYVLAVIGAVSLLPSLAQERWLPILLEPVFLTVVLLNGTAASENLMLMFQRSTAAKE
jgi:phosphatidylglycerophosphate synthase